MKYANVGDERREAAPGLPGRCPRCDQPVIPKCGPIKVPHWAHIAVRNCDAWWERETEWHRAWKDEFPKDWQEIVQRAPDGEKHIADVKTAQGVVVEFQNSFLRPEERDARERFYGNMAWVVNGLRRVRDRQKVFEAIRVARLVAHAPLTFEVSIHESALLRDWAASRVRVFFDFGEASEPTDKPRLSGHNLWLMHPSSAPDRILLTPVTKAAFLDAYVKGLRLKARAYKPPARRARAPARYVAQPQSRRWPPRPESFQEYFARKEAARRRRRF